MHDPDVLLFAVRRLGLDVWHREPAGHDSAAVCGHHPMPIPARLAWAIRHARHLRLRWRPAYRLRHWATDRCDHCGHRFRRGEARFSYQSTDRVWHDPCMSLRHARGQLDDLTGYVLGTADRDARWRAEYRLTGLGLTAAVASAFNIEPSAVGIPAEDTPPPPTPCPNGFHWIGQSFAHCDQCGLPAWDHDGMAEGDRDSPWGAELVLRPWRDGEREAIQRRWAPKEPTRDV